MRSSRNCQEARFGLVVEKVVSDYFFGLNSNPQELSNHCNKVVTDLFGILKTYQAKEFNFLF